MTALALVTQAEPIAIGRRPVTATGDVARLSLAQRRAREDFPVALVSMPFVIPYRPSIQLGLLDAIATSHGFPVQSFSFFLDLAARLGMHRLAALADLSMLQLGDWLFSVAAFGDDAPDPDAVALRAAGPHLDVVRAHLGVDPDWLCRVRDIELPAFCDELADSHDWPSFGVVGFTSTFEQQAASLALARRIKERAPDTTIVFGGANLEGPMGPAWLRAMPFIDLAVSGEADRAFPALLIERCAGRSGTDVSGVLSRDGTGVVVGAAAAPIEDLDELPVPDYREYFSRAEALGLLPRSPVRDIELSFESARGCWWGAKRQCTFCGLNGSTIRFRSKSSERVLDEMAELSKAYGSFRLAAVDNILDLDYFGDVLDPLGATTSGYDIFYELKADVSREHIRRLRAAGVTRVQPGIESLSSPVLGLMRKGTRAHHNVNLLRWCAYYGVDVAWNLLYGFPGEQVEHYVEQAALLDALTHLQPPGGVARIHIERFSPIFEDRERFPIDELRPHRSYASTYPSTVDLAETAYLFEGHIRGALPDDAFEALHRAVDTWRARRSAASVLPTLVASRGPGIVHVDDGRDPSDPVTYVFEGALAEAYLACFDTAQKLSAVAAAVGVDVSEVETILDGFCSRGLMLRDGNLFLALALPATPLR